MVSFKLDLHSLKYCYTVLLKSEIDSAERLIYIDLMKIKMAFLKLQLHYTSDWDLTHTASTQENEPHTWHSLRARGKTNRIFFSMVG